MLIKTNVLFFFYSDCLSRQYETTCTQVPSGPLLLATMQKCVRLSCAEPSGNSEIQYWSKIFFEHNKEFKVRNILEREGIVDPTDLRKCLKVSFHSHSRKGRFS